MSVAVRVAFVGDGTGNPLARAAPTPSEALASWTAIPGVPSATRMPAPPNIDAWARAFSDLAAANIPYLAPGHGSDDDPAVAVLRELAGRGTISLTVGPESAPAIKGPAVTGSAATDWRPAPGMQTLVRGIADDHQLNAWRSRLLAAYGSDAIIEVRPWASARWQPGASAEPLSFPISLRALPTEQSRLRDTNTLLDIARQLRGPGGCPWDKNQTHATLRPYLVEEAHEALVAIEQENDRAMADEFGDVLLNLVLHAEIARQRGGFDWPDVVAAISAKMIRRHPHVFGDVTFEDLEDLGKSWVQIKAAEHGGESGPLDGLPDSLPSLAFAHSAVRALRRAGSRQDPADGQVEAVAALTSGVDAKSLGDALLWVAGRADAADINLDMALRDANARLRERWSNSHGHGQAGQISREALDRPRTVGSRS